MQPKDVAQIQADVADLVTKATTLQTDQGALVTLQATADAANQALQAGTQLVATDKTAVDASLAKLQADIVALEGGTPGPATAFAKQMSQHITMNKIDWGKLWPIILKILSGVLGGGLRGIIGGGTTPATAKK